MIPNETRNEHKGTACAAALIRTNKGDNHRYVCPGCGAVATAPRSVNLVCGDCRFDMWRR